MWVEKSGKWFLMIGRPSMEGWGSRNDDCLLELFAVPLQQPEPLAEITMAFKKGDEMAMTEPLMVG